MIINFYANLKKKNSITIFFILINKILLFLILNLIFMIHKLECYFVLSVLLSLTSYGQDKSVDTLGLGCLQKVEFSLLSAGFNYEFPIRKNLSLDSSVGFASGAKVFNQKMSYEFSILNPCFYFKSELKYYYNRYVRIAKKLPTRNGEGSYFAFQNKFMTQRLFDENSSLSNIMMTEVHWGIQRNIYRNFLFNFHVGLGRSYDFTTSESSNYTSFGLKVSYLISTNKINGRFLKK